MSDRESSKEDEVVYIPPLSGSEEEAMGPASNAKDKGLQQSEVFETQRLMNGTNPVPSVVKKYTQRWGYFINNYSERKADGKVYVKVDGAFQVISNILFNDESEHQFKIQAHMLSLKVEDVCPEHVEEEVVAKFKEAISDCEHANPFMDWQVIKEVASHFPEAFLTIIQDVFPEVKSTAIHADVTKELLNLKTRFDVTKAKQVDAQLNRYVTTLQKYKLQDLTGSHYQTVFNRLKEHLFKENPDARYSKEGAGSVFGHHLPNGDWVYHNLPAIQSSKIRELLNKEETLKIKSLNMLLFQLVIWLSEPQQLYRQALEAGFNIEFYPVVSNKRQLEGQPSAPAKAPKSSKSSKAKSVNGKVAQESSSEAPINDHPQNKCAGCGNKFEWQRANDVPVCSKTVCTFASHPDFNSSKHWSSSEVAKAYAGYIRNKKGAPVHSLTQNKRLVRDGNGKIIYPAKTERNEVSKVIYNNQAHQNLISLNNSCNNNSTLSFSEAHTSQQSPSIDEQLEADKSSYEADEENETHEVNQDVNINSMEIEPTLAVDEVATPSKDDNLNAELEATNPLQLLDNSLGDSSTSQQLNDINHNKPLVQCKIQGLVFHALLDACSTGPEGYIVNYIHPDVVQKIKSHQADVKKQIIKKCSCARASTCTGVGCFETSTCVTLKARLFDEISETEDVVISFRVSKGIPYDIIIGNYTFRDHDLSSRFRHLFTSINNLSSGGTTSEVDSSNSSRVDLAANFSSHEKRHAESSSNGNVPAKPMTGSRRSSRLQHAGSLQSPVMDSLVERMENEHLGTLWLSSIILEKEDLLTAEEVDAFEDDIPSNPMEDILNNVSIGWDDQSTEQKIKDILGNVYDKQLKIKILPLLRDFIDIFRKELPATPAKIEPMKLTLIEGSDWYINRKNKQSPRLQVIAKQYALRKFILKAIANSLIKPSNAISWSHPHLTIKPSGEYRVCMDWKGLNQESLMNGWPLPNIKDIIHRLGDKKANYFAVIDLTQGYWQIPIHEDSQHLTAFRTAEGLYEWTRLGMGLKGAGPYFQYHMANTIFPELIYKILEVYLDDIITWGETLEELIQNLMQIFIQLRKFGVFINPQKIKIGLTEIEYVGHTIDRYGEKFSQKKQDQVLNFRTPSTVKEMKSFLGVIGQFREHVDHFGDITALLYRVVDNYQASKHKLINWTPELSEVYENVKQKVANCPKLFFINDVDPIVLSTDASNIGIGAYLYQEREGRKLPIRFISKTLSKAEKRWDTVEKEAYAIFFALKKLKYLLHDKSFTIRTDSKNLSYMNAENKSQKVQRWKLHCQEFDFRVEHIPGEENIEADGFSRLVQPLHVEGEANLQLQALELDASLEQYQVSKINYEKIKSVHGGVLGHLGVNKTIQAILKNHKKWPSIKKDVRLFIKSCYACQKMSQHKNTSIINPFTLATIEPMQRVYIDTIGPINSDHQTIEANDNYNYVLVIIDAFSRFIQIYPTKTTSAQDGLYPFIQWISNFGVPSEITTDNGTQFANQLIEQFCDVANIDANKIHAYSKEENSMVERANKEVFRHLIPMINDKKCKDNFVPLLPFAQRIMNTMEHEVLKVSPSQIIFGSSIDHDVHLITQPEHNSSEFNYSSKIQHMLEMQQKFLDIARQNQLQDDRLKLARRQIDKETDFPINSYVLAEYYLDK